MKKVAQIAFATFVVVAAFLVLHQAYLDGEFNPSRRGKIIFAIYDWGRLVLAVGLLAFILLTAPRVF